MDPCRRRKWITLKAPPKLAGIDLPKTTHELVEYASSRLPPDSEVLRVIASLPARTFRTAADIAKAFGELRSR